MNWPGNEAHEGIKAVEGVKTRNLGAGMVSGLGFAFRVGGWAAGLVSADAELLLLAGVIYGGFTTDMSHLTVLGRNYYLT